MPDQLRHVWLPFADVRKSTTTTADGTEVPTRIVTGIMTDETLDLDGQIVDFESAKTAASEWFRDWANVREQHSQNAVGTGIEMQVNDALKQIVVTSEIVDPTAIVKIDKKVYRGQSVGLKGARVEKDAVAPNGRLVGFTQVENSIVDRPANPSAKLAVVKMAKDGSLEPGEALTISDAEIKKIAGTEAGKLAEVRSDEPKVDAAKAADDLAEHADSLAAASAAIRAVLVEEASEDEPGSCYQLEYLVDALQRLEWFRNAEMYEYSEAYLAAVPDLQKAVEAKDAKRAIALLRTAEVGTAMALKAAGVDVAKGHTVEVKPDGTVTSWRDDAAGEEGKSVKTDPAKAARPAAAEAGKADAHSHVHTHEDGTDAQYQHDHGHAHDDMHAEGEDGDHRHDHTGAKAATVAPAAAEPDKTKAATSAETDKQLTADTLKAAVSEAVTKAFDERVKPLEEKVAEMAGKAAPGGAFITRRQLAAPDSAKAVMMADRVKQATELLEHNDPQVRLWAQQALAELNADG